MARKKTDNRQFWTLDAETPPFRHRRKDMEPFIWGLYTGAGFHTFETVSQVVEAIQDQDVIVYAHNGGKFDFYLGADSLFNRINQNEEMKIINGRVVSAKIGRCEIRDSWNLLPSPLREFGGKLEIDYRKHEPKVRHLHMPEITRYLMQDCVGLWNGIAKFEQQYGRHLTQAGAAMAQWERISGIKAPKTDAPFFAKFTDYYHGGHVQTFQRGYIKGPGGVWDIRSAYPWAMLSEHPYDPMYQEFAFPREIRATDMVTLDCVSIGSLPFRDDRGITTYPRDNLRRRYKVPGHEILAGIETGSLREIDYINAIRFGGQKDFSAYIHHFYEARKVFRNSGDTANAYFAKILMNSLYGKFGANPDNYGNFICIPWEDKLIPREDGYEFNGRLAKHAVMRRDLDTWQKHFINVATAASITSQVRAKLWRAINDCDNPYYCDTDCVFAERAPNLEIGEELGQWNLEGTFTDLYIAGKKTYYAKGNFGRDSNGAIKREKMASKGMKPDKRKIKAAALGGTVKVKSDAPTFTIKPRKDGSHMYYQTRTMRMTGSDLSEGSSPPKL